MPKCVDMRPAWCTPRKWHVWQQAGFRQAGKSICAVSTTQIACSVIGKFLCEFLPECGRNAICVVCTTQMATPVWQQSCAPMETPSMWWTPHRSHVEPLRPKCADMRPAWCTPRKWQVWQRAGSQRAGKSILRCHLCGAHHADRMSALLPEQLAVYAAYDLYGPHHVNGAWASPLRCTHVPQVRHLSSKLQFGQKRHKKRAENCTYYLCGAHHTYGTSSTSGTSFLQDLSKLALPFAWCTPRRSHFGLLA